MLRVKVVSHVGRSMSREIANTTKRLHKRPRPVICIYGQNYSSSVELQNHVVARNYIVHAAGISREVYIEKNILRLTENRHVVCWTN